MERSSPLIESSCLATRCCPRAACASIWPWACWSRSCLDARPPPRHPRPAPGQHRPRAFPSGHCHGRAQMPVPKNLCRALLLRQRFAARRRCGAGQVVFCHPGHLLDLSELRTIRKRPGRDGRAAFVTRSAPGSAPFRAQGPPAAKPVAPRHPAGPHYPQPDGLHIKFTTKAYMRSLQRPLMRPGRRPSTGLAGKAACCGRGWTQIGAGAPARVIRKMPAGTDHGYGIDLT